MTFSRFYFAAITVLSFAILMASASAYAQDATEDTTQPVDILPAAVAQERGITYEDIGHTHPAIKMTPDKSELIRLDAPAGSIIIGNPNHLSILADTADTLVLVPRAPGATHFTVLGKDGRVLMQRHVIVASPKEKYIRVRRSCAGSDDKNCQTTSVFYCPDMCHEIMLGGAEGGAETANAAPASGGSAQDTSIDPGVNAPGTEPQ